jgi:hypothetical protein
MKNLSLSIIVLLIGFVVVGFSPINDEKINNETKVEYVSQSDYCDGWEDGYCEGWRDIKGQYALCPLTPLCPLPKLGKDRYRDGYNRGFKAGSRAAQK